VSGQIVCGVCGTVNVGVFSRCIACGQDLGRAVGSEPDEPEARAREDEDMPISQEREVTGPVSVPKPKSGSSKSRSNQARQAALELESASFRQTIVEIPTGPATAAIRGDKSGENVVKKVRASRSMETGPAATTPERSSKGRFVARLLLPEGDRRSVEIGTRPVVIGSGLDQLGLAGDPKMGSAEARLFIEDGRLFVEPAPDALNVYRRIDREMKLREGDVLLVGDIAATFTETVMPGAVDGTRQILGGSANAPCGRLVFLRRDGTPGPVHDLPAGKTVLGRTDGHLNFPHDSRLSRRHALLFASDQGVTLEDMDSRNGTYLRVRERTELHVEDALRVGSAGLQIRAK
jgi:FHA domain